MFTKTFWKDTAERMISTAAQTGVLFFGADAVNILQFNWLNLVGFMLGGAFLSLLKALASGAVDGTPALFPSVTAPPVTADGQRMATDTGDPA